MSNNVDRTNSAVEDNSNTLTTMNKEGDWERNVGCLTGEMNDR